MIFTSVLSGGITGIMLWLFLAVTLILVLIFAVVMINRYTEINDQRNRTLKEISKSLPELASRLDQFGKGDELSAELNTLARELSDMDPKAEKAAVPAEEPESRNAYEASEGKPEEEFSEPEETHRKEERKAEEAETVFAEDGYDDPLLFVNSSGYEPVTDLSDLIPDSEDSEETERKHREDSFFIPEIAESAWSDAAPVRDSGNGKRKEPDLPWDEDVSNSPVKNAMQELRELAAFQKKQEEEDRLRREEERRRKAAAKVPLKNTEHRKDAFYVAKTEATDPRTSRQIGDPIRKPHAPVRQEQPAVQKTPERSAETESREPEFAGKIDLSREAEELEKKEAYTGRLNDRDSGRDKYGRTYTIEELRKQIKM